MAFLSVLFPQPNIDKILNEAHLDDAGNAVQPALRAIRKANKPVKAAYDDRGNLTLTVGNRTPKPVQSLVNAVGARAALRLLEKAGCAICGSAIHAASDEEDFDTSSIEGYFHPIMLESSLEHWKKRR
jgi:hypothetical protein